MPRPGILAALLAAGCAASAPSGPAPRVAVPRAVSLQLDVTGNDKTELDAYLDWILKDNGLLRRVPSGGDLRLGVEATLDEAVHLLAGTDLTLTVRVHADNLDERRTWTRAGLTSQVPLERDKVLTEAASWALVRAATASSLPPAAATPAPSRIELPASDEAPPPPPATPAATSHKKKRRR